MSGRLILKVLPKVEEQVPTGQIKFNTSEAEFLAEVNMQDGALETVSRLIGCSTPGLSFRLYGVEGVNSEDYKFLTVEAGMEIKNSSTGMFDWELIVYLLGKSSEVQRVGGDGILIPGPGSMA